MSGVTILGTPAEIYNFGTQYWVIVPAIWIMGIIVAYVYLPVFCKLKVNSSYEVIKYIVHCICALYILIVVFRITFQSKSAIHSVSYVHFR